MAIYIRIVRSNKDCDKKIKNPVQLFFPVLTTETVTKSCKIVNEVDILFGEDDIYTLSSFIKKNRIVKAVGPILESVTGWGNRVLTPSREGRLLQESSRFIIFF